MSCVGQADDVALLSNDVYSLHNILQLTLSYCEKFHVKLCSTKTKTYPTPTIIIFSPLTQYQSMVNTSPLLVPLSMLGSSGLQKETSHMYLGEFLPTRKVLVQYCSLVLLAATGATLQPLSSFRNFMVCQCYSQVWLVWF